MIEYKGKRVKLHIIKNGADLFYTALITDVNDTHITFIDKYKKQFTFKLDLVQEISDL